MKLNLFLILVLTLAFPAFAQSQPSTCKLTPQNAPRVAGLHLGMTLQETNQVLKVPFELKEVETYGFSFSIDSKTGEEKSQAIYANVGEKESSIDNRQELFRRNEKLTGIERIDLKFFENKLFVFAIFYEKDTYNFTTVRPFGLALAASYKLPANSWLWFDETAYKTCQGFTVTAFNRTSKMTDLSKITAGMKPENINALPLIDKKFIVFTVTDSRIQEQLKEKSVQASKQERKD